MEFGIFQIYFHVIISTKLNDIRFEKKTMQVSINMKKVINQTRIDYAVESSSVWVDVK